MTASRPALHLFVSAMRQRSRAFLESALASALINLLSLATSLFAMQVYDRVVPNSAFSTLKVLFVGVCLCIALEAMMKLVRVRLLDATGKLIETELSQRFFNKALGIRMDARPNTVGTFASQIREFESVKNFLTSTTLFVIADAPFALLFLAIIFLIGGPVGWVALAALPLTLLISVLIQRPLAGLSRQSARESTWRNGMMIESIDGAETVKASGAESWFSRRWYELGQRIGDVSLKSRWYANLASVLGGAIQQLCYACTVLVGVYLIADGALTVGGLIACTILVNRVLSPISQLTAMSVNWNAAKAALEMLDDLWRRPSAGPDDDTQAVRMSSLQPSLSLENIKVHHGDDPVLALTIDKLHIKPGEKVAIVGASGMGKSTLLKVLSGLYKPSEGRGFYGGIDMQLLEPLALRRELGYLPQDVRLFNGTLRDNLLMGCHAPTDDQLMAVCAMTGVNQVIARHPRGISMPIHEGGRGLSGGQRQMVALSRVLLQGSSTMLLDEPTASLDQKGEQALIRALKAFIRPDQTVVIATHKLPILDLVQRIIVIDQHRIVLDGPLESVLKIIAPQTVNKVGHEQHPA